MSRFLVVGFEFGASFHYALILCKPKGACTEYKFTVMNGEIEQQLRHNKTIREIDGCLYFQPSQCRMEHDILTAIAAALGNITGMPVKEAEAWNEAP